jgi:hypothetical protein
LNAINLEIDKRLFEIQKENDIFTRLKAEDREVVDPT